MLKAHDAIVCFKCFRCFQGMLQVLYIDVAKVYRDVAHIVVAILSYVSSVCSKCFICSRQMLQVFCMDVAKVDLDVAYTCMLRACV